MKTLDYSQLRQQITATVDYTEVIFLPISNQYVVVWHDNIVAAYPDQESAIKEYRRLITRKPTRGDCR
jgi:hypothetical protein